ncbi:UPF0481 protein At3g47200-like [Benincasa hispida]|uniref:UPF0481 protein At3g47200-like n=1 Tax=Benincasa hispida TaxID=102211 RepID=UPI0019020D67|nr:UPF0481 protein At3g47200-like [Benincasa hispida]
MDKGEGDHVTISIKKTLMELPPTNPESFLYKVPRLRRKMNETVYTPQFISIGPFHHGRPELMAVEQYKLRALKTYLARVNLKVEEAMSMTFSWEEKARSCYGHSIDMNKQDFAKMMLLDGCFILEFMNSTNYMDSLLSKGDHEEWIDGVLLIGVMDDVERDLIIFENQLPFFVLQQLYELSFSSTKKSKDLTVNFMEWMAELFISTTSGYALPFKETTKVRHVVDLLRFYYIPSPETDEYNKFNDNEGIYSYQSPTITKLCETGIKVQRAMEADSMMDFSFKNGVLKIPPFRIHTNFEIQIRNLIVSEIFNVVEGKKYIFHYLLLLDDLIKTEKDVSILMKEKIIINETDGSAEQVLKLIHNLHLIAPSYRPQSYFNNMSRDLDNYCEKRWQRSMASLRRSMASLKRDYFSTPWAFISFLAATFLLILSLLQTLFSAPSIFHKK